ncbi:DUF6438 domain-containing protein [Solimonas flava]|uniref:DUF6438 domain-containing protein n=1 Tax=Solimonas flava TaxID=415849 RepID=UPI000483F181|nr:DUF6438 domain-containing protein [Solimonas flava]
MNANLVVFVATLMLTLANCSNMNSKGAERKSAESSLAQAVKNDAAMQPLAPERSVPAMLGTEAAQTDNGAAAVVPGATGPFSIGMRHGPCYGRCPVYRVTLYSDGRVEFVGDRFVAAPGVQNKQIDVAGIAALGAQARRLFTTVGDVKPGTKSCGTYATDMPQISLEFDEGGRARTIAHYTGCANVPAALAAFERSFAETVAVDEWVKGPVLR